MTAFLALALVNRFAFAAAVEIASWHVSLSANQNI